MTKNLDEKQDSNLSFKFKEGKSNHLSMTE